jgi:predicted TIM-barrel fold metal-dependent hydrolase
MAAEAGRLGLAIHIHTGSGCGDYFDTQGAQPVLLSSVLNDPSLRGTTFVLLHGGTPFERTVSALILKPNVFVDMSMLALLWSPAELSRTIRPWLEMMPEHVLFGTDAGPTGPGLGWEETTWLASRNARAALSAALEVMADERVVNVDRGREIARRVLHDNAAELYHLAPAGSSR